MQEFDYEGYTAKELCQRWNYLEMCRFSERIEIEMDEIERVLLHEHGVEAWDNRGNPTNYR